MEELHNNKFYISLDAIETQETGPTIPMLPSRQKRPINLVKNIQQKALFPNCHFGKEPATSLTILQVHCR